MSNRKSFTTGILVSLAAIFALLTLTGAVKPKSKNYYSSMGFNGTQPPAMHVACSADGSVVYISDETRVMRSRDYGNDWEIIITRVKSESSQE